MSPRVDVRPDEFYVIAQDVAGDVLAAVTGGLDPLGVTLAGCGSMAGSDPAGLAWADAYDTAASAAVRAGRSLANGIYHLAELLEQTGVNHERAETASTTHPGGSVAGGLRAATLRGAWLHDPSYRFTIPDPPSASGGHAELPVGWDVVRHYLHCVWPDGHQDRLHAAAHAWDTSAAGLETAASDMISVWARLSIQDAPEVVDACNTCEAVREHLLDLAGAYRRLARACRALAAHIDTAHAAVISQLEDLLAWTIAIQSVGAVVSFFTIGAAEAPTQAEQFVRLMKTVNAIDDLLSAFATEVRLLLESLPTLTEIADHVAAALDRLASIRIEISEVAGAPGYRVLTITTRDTRVGTGITRTEMSAEDGLARSAASGSGEPLVPYSGELRINSDFEPPKISVDRHGNVTNGRYRLSSRGMRPHTTGSLSTGKSQFFARVDSDRAVLDAAAYADSEGLWNGVTAKVYVENGPVGVAAKTGRPTRWINLYRTASGVVHGCPGNPP